MVKSWLGWFTGNAGGNWDRRSEVTPEPVPADASDIDPTTGSLRLASFTAALEAERQRGPGALLVVDLDDQLADVAATIDKNTPDILPLLSQAIGQAVRSGDLITHLHHCRFAVLLRGAAPEIANEAARRIRESVADTLFLTEAGILNIGVAVGGVVYTSSVPGQEELLDAAITNLGAAQKFESHILIQ